MAIRVFVAEDHPLYRRGLVDALSARRDFELVGEAVDGSEALDALHKLEPDVAVLDVKMPAVDGIEVVRQLVAAESKTRVILLSGHLEPALVFEAMDAGASGYLAKESAAKEICDAVVRVADGRTVLSPGLEAGLVQQIGSRSRDAELSRREQEILGLLAEGLTAGQIAKRVNLSEATVKTYVGRAYEKLGVTNRAAAIAEGMRRGIID